MAFIEMIFSIKRRRRQKTTIVLHLFQLQRTSINNVAYPVSLQKRRAYSARRRIKEFLLFKELIKLVLGYAEEPNGDYKYINKY